MIYHILKSKKNKRIRVTKSYKKMYAFIIHNPRSKIFTIPLNGNPRILRKQTFLKAYLLKVNDKDKFFLLTSIMLKNIKTQYAFIKQINLSKDFKDWRSRSKFEL